ncbi:CBS domain-containing protein [Methanopyrus sp. SNP6]|uniref:CBS domain-containing protein n=1 Tax=Methanopyrus sp. SNP6 TaxID=1937005 RepID=UPI0011E58C8B|nr:CBS domain-containing protein [Methanopyrus sp. SNP6]
MPERLYVRDYMVTGVVQVRMTDTVRDAVREMVRAGVHGLAVVGPDGELVGVLEEEHIMDLVVERGRDWADILETTVEEVMDPEPAIVEPNDTLLDALEEMERKKTTRAFVLSCEGTPVGVVSVTDVLSAIVQS